MTEDRGADEVQDRLMYHVNDQAVSADKAEYGDVEAKDAVPLVLFDKPPEKPSADKQEQPRDQREVVGGTKAERRQSDGRKKIREVQLGGQHGELRLEEADLSVRHAVEKGKEQKAHKHTDKGRDMPEGFSQRVSDQHRTTDQIQYAEPDLLARHEDQHD